MRRTLDIVNKLFPWRSCTKEITGTDPRPCLDYYINRCIAPCTSYCTKEEYDEVIRQVILFLEGRTEEVVREVTRQMGAASDAMEFERAARLRDQLQAIERVTERQTVASTRPADEDIFGLARGDDDAVVQVLFVRGIKMVGVDSFTLDGAKDETDADVLGSFVKQFYESATYVPKRVIVPMELPEHPLIESWLTERRGTRVELLAPQRGEKRRLIEMATNNARETFDMARVKWLADTGKTRAALEGLQEELDLPALPAAHRVLRHLEHPGHELRRLDGRLHRRSSAPAGVPPLPHQDGGRRQRLRVDGRGAAAALPPCAGETPARYGGHARPTRRRRRDNGERPADDESFAALPDLVIIDGGKGQLSAVIDVMREMGVKDIPTVGLAKAARGDLRAGRLGTDRSAPPVAGAVPRAAHPRRGAPLRHHLPPRFAGEGQHPVGTRHDRRRRPQAEEGAAEEVRLREGHPRSAVEDVAPRSASRAASPRR